MKYAMVCNIKRRGIKSAYIIRPRPTAMRVSQRFCGIWLAIVSCMCSSPGACEQFTVIDFLKDVRRMHGFEYVLIVSNRNSSLAEGFVSGGGDWNNENSNDSMAVVDMQHLLHGIMTHLAVPAITLNELVSFYLKQRFSATLLTVVYMAGDFADHSGLFRQLTRNLRHMMQSKVIFLLNHTSPSEHFLRKLFQFCWLQKMLNVVALFGDYQLTLDYYGYSHFPDFRIERNRLSGSKHIFPYRLGKLNGYKLPYILGGSEPRIIAYKNARGERVIKGFVGHFLRAFEKKHDCILYEPLPSKSKALVFAPAQELIAAVRNGTVEISAGLTFLTVPIVGYTYPYELINWCLLTPVEPDIPSYEFYVIVFETSAFLATIAMMMLISMLLSVALYRNGYRADIANVVLHDNCLRGILGQSFVEIPRPPKIVRFIYLQICVLGILLTTSYNSYFATYLTSPPKEAPLRSFDDILNSNMKVYAWTPEYYEIIARIAAFRKYKPMYKFEPDYAKYLAMRDTLTTKYIFMLPTTKWNIVNEQQKISSSPIFRNREDLCYFNTIPMSFPVHENSLYKQTLHELILETYQAGLTQYWQRNGFSELIEAGKLSFADLSVKREFQAMKVDDLRYVWYGLATSSVLGSLILLLELAFYYKQNIGIKLKLCCLHAKRIVLKYFDRTN